MKTIWKLDIESRSLLKQFRSDKRARVIKVYRARDFDALNKAVGQYHKAERVYTIDTVSIQISQKTY